MTATQWLAAFAVCLTVAAAAQAAPTKIAARDSVTKTVFGKTADGAQVDLITLTNKNGLTAKIMTFGAILVSLQTPDKNGEAGEITLGFDTFDGYAKGHPFFGAIAGRYANRIAKGKFSLDGKEYTLATNNGPNHLHGGNKGFDKVIWDAKTEQGKDGSVAQFHYVSKAGEEGYPGKLDVTVTYTLTDADALRIDYRATTDAATPVNLTNHTYFNLAGKGDVLNHMVTLAAPFYTPVDDTLIPTGEIRSVTGTPFDFTMPHTIGERLKETGGDPVGYDHNFVLGAPDRYEPKFTARVVEPTTGRVLEMYTTEPGVQFYTANQLNQPGGRGGVTYEQYGAFCLEAQHFPDSPNRPHFPSTILRPGQTYHQTTEYRFSVSK